MAALILDERCFILACLILVRANENGTGYFWDQCCHLHGDGASLFQNFCLILVSLILTISTLNRISALNRRSIESQMLLLVQPQHLRWATLTWPEFESIQGEKEDKRVSKTLGKNKQRFLFNRHFCWRATTLPSSQPSTIVHSFNLGYPRHRRMTTSHNRVLSFFCQHRSLGLASISFS